MDLLGLLVVPRLLAVEVHYNHLGVVAGAADQKSGPGRARHADCLLQVCSSPPEIC